MFGHSNNAQMLRGGAEHPDSARARHVDISPLVALHAVDDAIFENAVADFLGEHAAVAERAVGSDIERANVRLWGIVHVKNFFAGRKTHAVRLAKIIRFQMQLPVGRNSV